MTCKGTPLHSQIEADKVQFMEVKQALCQPTFSQDLSLWLNLSNLGAGPIFFGRAAILLVEKTFTGALPRVENLFKRECYLSVKPQQ